MGVEVMVSCMFKKVWLKGCFADAEEPNFTDGPGGSAKFCAWCSVRAGDLSMVVSLAQRSIVIAPCVLSAEMGCGGLYG